jgi:hypothetical protein
VDWYHVCVFVCVSCWFYKRMSYWTHLCANMLSCKRPLSPQAAVTWNIVTLYTMVYYDTRYFNTTNYGLNDSVAPLWWRSAAETCGNGLTPRIYICNCNFKKFQLDDTCTVLYYLLQAALYVSGVSHAHHQELNLNCIHSIWVDKL